MSRVHTTLGLAASGSCLASYHDYRAPVLWVSIARVTHPGGGPLMPFVPACTATAG